MYYFKQALFGFIYLLFMGVACVLIITIDTVWLEVLLSSVMLVFFIVIDCAIAYKDGQDAVKVRTANDLERKALIKTGTCRPLKIHEEYKPWKGFLIGFLITAPLLVLLTIHIIVGLATNGSVITVGGIAAFIYGAFYGPFKPLIPTISSNMWNYLIMLIAVPICTLANGISYYIGAKKILHQQEMIKKQQHDLYGE